MNELESLLAQLHDISGLDPIPLWPLAIGWWILITLGTLILSLASWYLIKWLRFKKSWKYDTLQKLNTLLKELSQPTVNETTIQNTLIVFSEYLRRIALRRFSRNTCAGLVGNAWLAWLTKHDPKHFDWTIHGKPLIHAPYAPKHSNMQAEQLKALIQAAKEWAR